MHLYPVELQNGKQNYFLCSVYSKHVEVVRDHKSWFGDLVDDKHVSLGCAVWILGQTNVK